MANGQLWEIDSQGNKKIISGMVTGERPKYTMAEYTALTDKPIDWICTDYDATSEYGINATEVKYDNSNSVADMLEVQQSYTIPTTPTDYGTFTFTRCGNVVQVEVNGAKVSTAQTYIDITSSLPAKFRPTLSTRTVKLTFIDNASTPSVLALLIYSSGLVRMYGYATTAKTYNIQDTKTYIV